MITEESSLEDVSFAVAAALERHGIVAVLTGGSAATVYAPAGCSSEDADFVLEGDESVSLVVEALRDTGFSRKGLSPIFTHPQSSYTLDFPKGPLAVGGDYVKAPALLIRPQAKLRILSRTDCVRDRLAHFYYWNDYTALNAAVAVAASNPGDVDVKLIRSWTQRESPDLLPKFAEFKQRLASALA